MRYVAATPRSRCRSVTKAAGRIDVTEPALAVPATLPSLAEPPSPVDRTVEGVARVAPADDPAWWRSAVIYQVYVRSFADGNGDGTGDLAGVRSRLPYLRDLGVDAIWFTPVVPLAPRRRRLRRRRLPGDRPGIRHARRGRGTHRRGPGPRHPDDRRHRPQPRFRPARLVPGRARGRAGLARAGALLVPTRSRPGWRRAARPAGHPSSRADTPGRGRRTPTARRGEWYLHLFTAEQPDLNWDHPEVRAEHEAILRFWFDRGRGRRPHRLGGPAGQGPDDARGPARAGSRRTPAPRPRRAARHLSIVAGRRRRVSRRARPRRRGLAPGHRALRALPPPGRAAHRLQLRLHGPPVGRGEPARIDRCDARRARARSAPRRHGSCRTTTSRGR